MTVPFRQIRATFTDRTIVVYQAYPPEIALPALRAGRFVPPFRRGRMTWIKPSFLWMMYRCGWATKPGQERVLAVELTRPGFDWALAHSCLSSFDPNRHGDHESWTRQLRDSPARVQWDPERSLDLRPLPYRSLQLGLSGPAVDRYVDEWVVNLSDVTLLARDVHQAVRRGDLGTAGALLPDENPYPVAGTVEAVIGSTRA